MHFYDEYGQIVTKYAMDMAITFIIWVKPMNVHTFLLTFFLKVPYFMFVIFLGNYVIKGLVVQFFQKKNLFVFDFLNEVKIFDMAIHRKDLNI